MAQEMTWLFGPSPYEIEQARNKQMNTSAENFAQMNATQRGVMGIYQGGAGLARMGAGMMGMVDPAVENARITEQIMGQGNVDLSSSAGLLAKAEEFRKAGDLRTATALALKGNELKKQEAASALAIRKQDFQEDEAFKLKRDQLSQQAELKKAQLEQLMEAAKLRSQDARYSADQRRDAATEANAVRLQLGQLMAEIRRLGIEAKEAATKGGMTPAQLGKLDLERRHALAGTLGVDNELGEVVSQIKLVQQHEGREAATGPIAGRLPNTRAKTIDYENQVRGAKGKLTKVAKDLMSESGKIGSMQVQEWQILLDTIAAIDPKMSAEDANIAFDNIVADLERKRAVHYAKLQEKYGTAEAQITAPALKIPEKKSRYVSGGLTQTATPATAPGAATDRFVVGKQYKDAKGNVATYLGNGNWK